MKVLLVSSTGGHLVQLYALERWWSRHQRTWVTFDQEDAISLLEGEETIWAHHPTTRNLWNLLRNFVLAIRTLRHQRPDLVVSTGAGVALPFFIAAKLVGSRTVFIEVFDRIDHPTLTARLCRPISDLILVQWEQQRDHLPKATVVGRLLFSLEMLDRFKDPSPYGVSNQPTVFVTLGMDHHPFGRLLRWAGEDFTAAFPECRLMVQHGPQKISAADGAWPHLSFGALVGAIRQADVVVTHGGPGTIGLAVALGKKPVVIPRLAEEGEAVDDHQVTFVRFMAEQGLIHIAESRDDLTRAVRAVLMGDLDGRLDPVETSEQGIAETFGRLVGDLVGTQ